MVGMRRSRNREAGKWDVFMVGVRRSRNARLEAQFRGAACKANKQDSGIMPLEWNQARARVREKVLGSFYPMVLRAII